MITFKEFVAERYYEPDEPLPSGKTPYGKATSSYYRQRGEIKKDPNRNTDKVFKIVRQGSRRKNEVSRGADNPNFDARPDKTGRYNITTDSDYKMSVRDRVNDVEMQVRQKDVIAPGKKPVYDVEWYNFDSTSRGSRNPGKARSVVRNVKDMWKNQVAPRIPNNSVLTNFPITNDTSERNTRSKLYSKNAGFGEVGGVGRQYANVGRPPSSKQAARGVQRITPLPGNLDPRYANRDAMIDLSADRMHLPKESRIRLDKNAGKPRVIAPAKPSRPLLNQGRKVLQSTPKMSAPTLPKIPRVNLPVTPKIPKIKIRGGGRAAIAGALISAGIGAYSAMSKKNGN